MRSTHAVEQQWTCGQSIRLHLDQLVTLSMCPWRPGPHFLNLCPEPCLGAIQNHDEIKGTKQIQTRNIAPTRRWRPVHGGVHVNLSKERKACVTDLAFTSRPVSASACICFPQLPYRLCENGTHSISFCNATGHTLKHWRKNTHEWQSQEAIFEEMPR